MEAIAWALAQPIQPSMTKFVLVVLAHCVAGKERLAWPATTYLEKTTGQNRKTVLDSLRRLRELGYIVDTGKRQGGTKSIVVYRLMRAHTAIEAIEPNRAVNCRVGDIPLSSPKNGTASVSLSSPENGTASPVQAVPNSVPLSYPKNGTASHTQACPSFEAGPLEEYRAQAQTKNKAVAVSKRRTACATRLATDWQLPEGWAHWARQARPDWPYEQIQRVAEQFRDYWLAKAGPAARKVDWQATWRNWVRREPARMTFPAPTAAVTAARAAENARAKAILFGPPPETLDV